MRAHSVRGLIGMICIAAWVSVGCSTSSAPLSSSVGTYVAAPPGAAKVRAGVTEFKVEAAPTSQPFAIGAGSLGEVAADELATLLAKSGRFDVVGRTALNQSLEQQGLSNIIQPGSLVRPAKVEGAEYILVGNLSNLSVTKKPATPSTFGKMKSWVQQSSQNKQVQIAATCNVGWKLIDPATGDVALSNNSQFARSGPASIFGIDVLEAAAATAQDVELPVSEDDREQVVRLALDDAVRKSLTKIDRFLQSRGGLQQGAVAATHPTSQPGQGSAAAGHSQGVPAPTAPKAPGVAVPAGKVCPACGALNDSAAKFCKRCGGNL